MTSVPCRHHYRCWTLFRTLCRTVASHPQVYLKRAVVNLIVVEPFSANESPRRVQ